jgi:hypothetical protein
MKKHLPAMIGPGILVGLVACLIGACSLDQDPSAPLTFPKDHPQKNPPIERPVPRPAPEPSPLGVGDRVVINAGIAWNPRQAMGVITFEYTGIPTTFDILFIDAHGTPTMISHVPASLLQRQ